MLEVTGIEKRYRGRTILKNVSFRANPGECIGIVGGNGCGKTTLLSILAGIRKPAFDNYRLWFRGKRREMERDLECGVGHVLGVDRFLKTQAGRLSGGEKKRLSIAAALSGRADILILDEPGAALDLEAKEQILTYIRSYVKAGGTVLLTSHEMGEIGACTTLYVLKDGVLVPTEAGLSARELIQRF